MASPLTIQHLPRGIVHIDADAFFAAIIVSISALRVLVVRWCLLQSCNCLIASRKLNARSRQGKLMPHDELPFRDGEILFSALT